eukprot:COSAG06_NODE_9840_length_1806_cov_1.974810_1_plen_505_part_10
MEGANALALGPAHPDIALLEDNAVAQRKIENDSYYRTAASEATLSGGGLHAARFTVRKGSGMMFGAIRADWDVKGGASAYAVQGHCFYRTYGGDRHPGGSNWEGIQGAKEADRIDLLLDLGVGSMTVFKNGERLGVMQKSGLGGAGVEYRWAVALRYKDDSACIDALPAAELEARKRERVAQRERERVAALEKGVFFRTHPDIALLEDNAVAEKTKQDYSSRAAASEATLSGSGLHAARFTVREGRQMLFGAIRADWNVQGGESALFVQGHCFYDTHDGQRYPDRSGWKGMQGAKEADRIDMLLDLGAGSMSVFKNGEPLGVMQDSGLGGAGVEYRWAVGLYSKGDSARIDAVAAAEVEALVQAREAREREREEREAQLDRELAQVQQEQERKSLARRASEQDLALPAGARLHVQGHDGDGVYVRWERRSFGANAHFVDFGGEGAQQVVLKGLSPSQLSVLPPLVVMVHVVDMVGGETVEVEDVSLDWSVSRLNATIAERRGVPA